MKILSVTKKSEMKRRGNSNKMINSFRVKMIEYFSIYADLRNEKSVFTQINNELLSSSKFI